MTIELNMFVLLSSIDCEAAMLGINSLDDAGPPCTLKPLDVSSWNLEN